MPATITRLSDRRLTAAMDDESLIALARLGDCDEAKLAHNELRARDRSVMGAMDELLAAADRFDAAEGEGRR